MTSLLEMVRESPFTAYSYAYPHKTAYRPLEPAVPLESLWAAERRDALFLYIHIPFCEMRCGFCNLFTTVHPGQDRVKAYLAALAREAECVAGALGGATFARMAIGGGTPTYLDAAQLDFVFDLAARVFGVDPTVVPASVETSSTTSSAERLRVLRERGVERISIGVQSFLDTEVAAAGRSQRRSDVEQALERIRDAGFPALNIDLIYGLPGQTEESWLASLDAALRYAPEELYLYPLYVRPLTGLGRRERRPEDTRLALYRAGREQLLTSGYEQVSLRMFRRKPATTVGRAPAGPVYCCQEDGMVGIGCGARSYTRGLHYSSEYAVGASGVRSIIDGYLDRSRESFASAAYGFALDAGDQRRRYLIQSLLQVEGLELESYRRRFGSELAADFPELSELAEHKLAELSGTHLRLTEAGLEQSDTIGPWLYSAPVRRRMESYELR